MGFETELNGGTELGNVMLAEFALDKPTLAEAAGGSETLTLDNEYAARGGTLAGIDFAAAVLLLPGAATTTGPAPFLSCEFIKPNAALCEPAR